MIITGLFYAPVNAIKRKTLKSALFLNLKLLSPHDSIDNFLIFLSIFTKAPSFILSALSLLFLIFYTNFFFLFILSQCIDIIEYSIRYSLAYRTWLKIALDELLFEQIESCISLFWGHGSKQISSTLPPFWPMFVLFNSPCCKRRVLLKITLFQN